MDGLDKTDVADLAARARMARELVYSSPTPWDASRSDRRRV